MRKNVLLTPLNNGTVSFIKPWFTHAQNIFQKTSLGNPLFIHHSLYEQHSLKNKNVCSFQDGFPRDECFCAKILLYSFNRAVKKKVEM